MAALSQCVQSGTSVSMVSVVSSIASHCMTIILGLDIALCARMLFVSGCYQHSPRKQCGELHNIEDMVYIYVVHITRQIHR